MQQSPRIKPIAFGETSDESCFSELLDAIDDSTFNFGWLITPDDAAKTAATTAQQARKEESTITGSMSSLKTEGKKRVRRQGSTPYSTLLQRRKRGEIQSLREEAQQLNAQLAMLQNVRHSRASTFLSRWRDVAFAECGKRQQAEIVNRRLRGILKNHLKVHHSLREAVQMDNVLEGMDFVFGSQPHPTSDSPLYQVDFTNSVMADLATSLESLRLKADTVCPKAGDKPMVVFRCENKRRVSQGDSVVETTGITPMACSMNEAADIVWGFITKINKDVNNAFRFVRKTNPTPFEMNATASLREGLLNVDAVSLFRRYDELNRIVLVGTTTWSLPNGALQFQDHNWTIISPSKTDPLQSCVVQCFFRLQVKSINSSVLQEDFVRTHEVLLASISQKLRLVMQTLQNVLLSKYLAY